MDAQDIDYTELQQLVNKAKLQPLSYVDFVLSEQVDGNVSLVVCRLDQDNWVAAVNQNKDKELLLTWSSGGRLEAMDADRYEPDALSQVIFMGTTPQEQNAKQLIVLPISTDLKASASPTAGWNGLSETSQKVMLAKVIAQQIIDGGKALEILQDKLHISMGPFDPFEL